MFLIAPLLMMVWIVDLKNPVVNYFFENLFQAKFIQINLNQINLNENELKMI